MRPKRNLHMCPPAFGRYVDRLITAALEKARGGV